MTSPGVYTALTTNTLPSTVMNGLVYFIPTTSTVLHPRETRPPPHRDPSSTPERPVLHPIETRPPPQRDPSSTPERPVLHPIETRPPPQRDPSSTP
ncbi:hypothetical protein J4Q44_G00291450, partial [Coregonus suidteri]